MMSGTSWAAAYLEKARSMNKRLCAVLVVLARWIVILPPALAEEAAKAKYEIVQQGDGWQLLQAGQPFYVKGAVDLAQPTGSTATSRT